MSDDRAQDERNQIGAAQEVRSRTRGGLNATAFGLSDIGCHRSVNQDTLGNRIGQFTAKTEELGLLYAIADGMGGHARGEVASAIAIEQLFARYYESDARIEARQTLARVMIETNAAVYQAGLDANSGTMGTTLTTILLRDNILYVGNIGDSRTYLIRGGKIKQLSQDHSLIGEQVRSGLLTEAQARTSSIRNVITRAVGYREQVEPDTFAFTVHVGDILLLCSDGLHGLVENEELARIISTKGLGEATTELIELARERGGPDNITALLVRIDQLGEVAPAAESGRSPRTAATDPDDDETKPLPQISLGHTEEIIADPISNSATTSEAVTLPSTRRIQETVPSAPAPPPMRVAAKPVTIIPPAPPQARAPIWLFVLIPLLLIAIVAAGAFAIVRERDSGQQTQPIVAPINTVAPTVIATATPSPVGAAASVPTPSAAPSTPTASTGAAPVGAQPTTASGPGGLPVLPRATPSSTVGAGSGTGSGQRARISGTIRFGNNVAIPDNFSRDWVVVLIDQAEWQQRRQAAE
ncbi:MAG TPA: protein phosphatase 2C domain-containing protein, partial [Thermomicrobiales bacterium]